LSLIWSFW